MENRGHVLHSFTVKFAAQLTFSTIPTPKTVSFMQRGIRNAFVLPLEELYSTVVLDRRVPEIDPLL